MNNQEAIYRLKAVLTMCDFRDAFGDRVDDKLYEDAVAMAIEALKAERWIPCSERLPSNDHNLEGFLVTSKLPNYLEDDVDVFFEVYYNGQFGSHWDGEQLGHVDDGVIAWMECPSPYKGDES